MLNYESIVGFCFFKDKTPYGVTIKVQVPEDQEDCVVQIIKDNPSSLRKVVVHVDEGPVIIQSGSIILFFNVLDRWDVENIKFSIASKLFTRRFIYWLKDVGLSLSMEEEKQVNVELIEIVEGEFEKGT